MLYAIFSLMCQFGILNVDFSIKKKSKVHQKIRTESVFIIFQLSTITKNIFLYILFFNKYNMYMTYRYKKPVFIISMLLSPLLVFFLPAFTLTLVTHFPLELGIMEFDWITKVLIVIGYIFNIIIIIKVLGNSEYSQGLDDAHPALILIAPLGIGLILSSIPYVFIFLLIITAIAVVAKVIG